MSVCTFCGGPLPPRARKWCSKRCSRLGRKPPCPNCGRPTQSGRPCSPCLIETRRPLYEKLERLWGEQLTLKEMADRLGLSLNKVAAHVAHARYAGFDLPRRYEPEPVDVSANKAVVKRFKKTRAPKARGFLTEKQKYILRLLQAAPVPLALRHLKNLCRMLDPPFYVDGQMRDTLHRLARRGLVRRVENEGADKWRYQYLWFVPVALDRQVLNLADAHAEKELAALIAEQLADLERGHFAETDYKAAFSLDGSSGEDGSFHDVLEDTAA